MIPARLQLKNFMSYGEGVPPLDLSGVRLACLSGDNGNGKTALLDAMTWALFGKTRAKSEEDVIRLGSSECAVLFDFFVGDVKYRVHRQRGRKGGAVWELQVWQEDGSLRSLTGTNRSETQEQIRNLLRMDYDTFLSTAYLAQGRADEFTRATPGKRKDVLAEILDLSRYDRLEFLAKERMKEATDRETDADRELRSIDAELEREDYYAAQLEGAQQRLAKIGADAEGMAKERETLFGQVQNLDEKDQQARDYETRIADIEEEIARNGAALAELERRVAAAEQIAARREEIEAAHKRLGELTERIGPLEQKFDRILSLEREARALESAVGQERERLERERYHVEREVAELEALKRELADLEQDVAGLDAQIAEFGDPEARRTAAEDARAKTDDALVHLRADHGALKKEAEGLEKRLAALCSSDASLCEYCGQSLPPEKRQQAVAETKAAQDELQRRIDLLTATGRDLKRDADAHRAAGERAQADLRAVAQFQARRSHAVQERERLAERLKTLPERQNTLARHDAVLKAKQYAQEEQERLLKITADLEKAERIREELAATRAELEQYKNAAVHMERLQQALGVLEAEPPKAGELRTLIGKREAQIEKARAVIERIRLQTASLPSLRRDLATLDGRIGALRETERQAEREIGQFTAALERCKTLREERKQREGEKQTAAKERELYRELTAAFGKKGVQALIIENTLPEIEHGTNELLGRMTDGAMQVRFETQREAKSKTAAGPIETLDLIISDDMGTRPYEMYSGGEAFRVNFALRVALSKMLAHRAGAPLQTLILDEGFGTQDPRGREAILDALHAIQEDFALILCITHIEELKDQFPTRIEVMKGETGSTFSVVS
ncbi:MAG TPA: SMC family ATPase [Armatimonadaceae bacterium]|nr:SMC family ATPase [Armatimonadaceae bacterium]